MLFIFSIILFSTGIYFLDIDYSLFIDFRLIEVNSSLFSFIVYLDWISLIFISFVLFISSVVILYRSEYLGRDKTLNRFIYLVVIFVASIIFLILRPNIFSILLGWDGLGLVSYCLVIYYQNLKSYNAGMLTALRNRLGDVALLFSISWIILIGR